VLFSALMALAMPAPAPATPPRILQIHREPLKAGAEAEYGRIESDTARKCAELRCPHAYLALESLTGAKEVWWFNGYESAADRKQVADAWASHTQALTVLAGNGKRKARLTGKASEAFARYREDLSAASPWLMGRGRFLVITVTRTSAPMRGTVFATEDGTRFVIVSAPTREAADAAAGPDARVFAVRPSWSYPAADWIAADPEFWRPGNGR
jgi:hypothetical protein